MARRSGSRPLLPQDVNAAQRAAQVVQLRIAGLSQVDIAERMGMSQSQVSRIIRKALEAQAHEGKETLRELELARLERLHSATWPAALRGNLGAASVVLKASERRSRLQGLDEGDAHGVGNTEQPVHLHVLIEAFVLNTPEDIETLWAEARALAGTYAEKIIPGANVDGAITRMYYGSPSWVSADKTYPPDRLERYREAIRNIAQGKDPGIGV